MNEIKQYKGLDYLVYKNDFTETFCAYVKLPVKHPFIKLLKKEKEFTVFERSYTYLNYDEVPVKCHGGLTFGSRVDKKNIDKFKASFTLGYWIGWDYSHAGDYIPMFSKHKGDKKWTEKKVEKECQNVINQIIKASKN